MNVGLLATVLTVIFSVCIFGGAYYILVVLPKKNKKIQPKSLFILCLIYSCSLLIVYLVVVPKIIDNIFGTVEDPYLPSASMRFVGFCCILPLFILFFVILYISFKRSQKT